MDDLGRRIDQMVAVPPYSLPAEARQAAFVELLKDELEYAANRNAAYQNYLRHWPTDIRSAERVADLPYLPVAYLKGEVPFSLVEPREIKRTLTSSSTTGQMPSRIVLDSSTARRMTKGVVSIAQDFIGSARRPYLVVDVPAAVTVGAAMGARGAAIRGLQPFASEVTYCLQPGSEDLVLDRQKLLQFVEARRKSPVLVYGFTYILWKRFVKPLREENICLDMPDVHILHSGGWKLLQEEAVDKKTFNASVASVFGCATDRVIDFYGMVENVGVIYPDCHELNKHVPVFADIIARDPLTLRPVREGETGIVQVCSVLPTSYPGHLLLTEDLAQVVAYDGCRCGRRGVCFRFMGRVPKAEVRGCGNIERSRQQAH
jgi:phenylacetate-coenzyme A ligase PaaK-like adenylate-forming protein